MQAGSQLQRVIESIPVAARDTSDVIEQADTAEKVWLEQTEPRASTASIRNGVS